jgi:Ni/Co efflux regulator RcnB
MKNFKLLSGLLVAAAVAIPAVSMAQDDHRDDHKMEQRADDHDRPAHGWKRGDTVPAEYRDNRYVVNDWRGHHLHEPPAGYHWVQVNGDFVLAAVATGVIADVLLNQ